MRKIKLKFIKQYESILITKLSNMYDYYNYMQYIHFMLAFAILMGIFFGLGSITTFNENFTYIAFSVNATIFGSFIFMKLYYEEKYQKEFDLQYNKYVAVLIPLLRILAIQFLVSGVLGIVVFYFMVSNITIALFFVLGFMIFLVINWLLLNFINSSKEDYIMFAYSFIIFMFISKGFKLIAIPNILVSLLLQISIVLILFMIGDILKYKDIDRLSKLWIRGLLLLVVLLYPSNQETQSKSKYKDYIGTSPVFSNIQTTDWETTKRYSDYNMIASGMYYNYPDEKVYDNRINRDTRLVEIEGDYYLESIYSMGDQYYRSIFDSDDGTLIDVETSIHDVYPEYQYNDEYYKIISPIDEVLYFNDYIFIRESEIIYKYDDSLTLLEEIAETVEYQTVTEYLGIDSDSLYDEKSNGMVLDLEGDNKASITKIDDSEFKLDITLPDDETIFGFYTAENVYVLIGDDFVYTYDKSGHFLEKLYIYLTDIQNMATDDNELKIIGFTHKTLVEYTLNLDDISNYVFKSSNSQEVIDYSNQYLLRIGSETLGHRKPKMEFYVGVMLLGVIILLPRKRIEYIK